jgi:hypothetical protein
LARKPVLFQPFIMSQLAREGRWDQRPFLAMLATGRLSCLVVHADLASGNDQTQYERYTAEMAGAIRRHYRPRLRGRLPGMMQFWVWYPAIQNAAAPSPTPR